MKCIDLKKGRERIGENRRRREKKDQHIEKRRTTDEQMTLQS